MSTEKPYPLLQVAAESITMIALGLALKELVFKEILTREQLDTMLARAEEIADAISGGKIVQKEGSGKVTIRDATPDDIADIEAEAPESFPAVRKAKKTLTV